MTKYLSRYSRSAGRNLNPGPPEHEAGVLTIRPRRSVSYLLFHLVLSSNLVYYRLHIYLVIYLLRIHLFTHLFSGRLNDLPTCLLLFFIYKIYQFICNCINV
jgi:hypothetical protein